MTSDLVNARTVGALLVYDVAKHPSYESVERYVVWLTCAMSRACALMCDVHDASVNPLTMSLFPRILFCVGFVLYRLYLIIVQVAEGAARPR